MGIITDIIAVVGAWITGVLDWIASAVEGVVSVFYDGETSKLTLVGVLLLFGLAMSLVFFAFRFIMGLVRK